MLVCEEIDRVKKKLCVLLVSFEQLIGVFLRMVYQTVAVNNNSKCEGN